MGNQCKTVGCEGPIYVNKHGLCSACYNRFRYHGKIAVKDQKTVPLSARLWSNVNVGNPTDCWEWQGKSRTAGYGSLYDGETRKRVQAHRAAWALTYGPIPKGRGAHGTVVLHDCDNRLCCNPAHLRLGTQGDNVRDMDKKGRRITKVQTGERHHATKITAADVREIRAANDCRLDQQFADRLGMSRAGVKQVRLRRTWKHID